jgi:F-type H+-transporting ATPase subunit beta
VKELNDIRLNAELLRRKVPNLTVAAKSIGIRPATVSNLCTGKIDLGKAEVRTLVGLASLANCSVDDLIIREKKGKMIETQIKVLDFFAPLVAGGTVGIVARPGMGQLVILAELLYRLKESSYETILLMPKAESADQEELAELSHHVVNTVEEAFDRISKLDSEIVFITDRSYLISGDLLDLQDRLVNQVTSEITTILVDVSGEVVDEEMPYGPLETLWQLDADLAARQLFPAVHPLHSTSSIVESVDLEQKHFSLRQRAQQLLRRYRELRSFVNVHGKERLQENNLTVFNRGELLEAYFTQPFFVAEAFTKQKGLEVSLNDTLRDVELILDGKTDSLKPEQVRYIGNFLPSML